MESQGAKRVVVLVPFPFQGHLSPMLELATALHSKGFSITIAHTKFNSPDPTNHLDFLFLPISDGITEKDLSSGDILGLISIINTNCEGPLKECLDQMVESEQEVACIVYDTVMYVAETVANQVKLPSIVLRTSGASALVAYGAMPELHRQYFPLQDSILQDIVPQLPPLRFKDLPRAESENLETLLQLISIVCNIRTSSALIWNTTDCLENPAIQQLQHHHQVPMFSIGPLFKIAPLVSSSSLLTEDSGCISWLNKQTLNSIMYISLGSLATVDEKDFIEMAWGVAKSGQPFLWVVRPGSVGGSGWIEKLPYGFEEEVGERGLIVKWAPQKEVLAHRAVGGFWSHCGWNSVLESVCQGVPMICSPCFGDQKVNARYVSFVWKVGLELEGELDRGKIEKVVSRLMGDEKGEEMRQRAADLKEKVEVCVKEGGSSYNSLNDLAEYILSL